MFAEKQHGLTAAELRTAQTMDEGEEQRARFEAWVGEARIVITGRAADVARIVAELMEVLP